MSLFDSALLYIQHQYPLHQADPPTTSSSPSPSHQSVLGVGEVRLLVAVVVGRPAVGHQEVKDGRVVGELRTGPAHHQSTAVDMLHLHVDGSAAACWEEDEEDEEGVMHRQRIERERKRKR